MLILKVHVMGSIRRAQTLHIRSIISRVPGLRDTELAKASGIDLDSTCQLFSVFNLLGLGSTVRED